MYESRVTIELRFGIQLPKHLDPLHLDMLVLLVFLPGVRLQINPWIQARGYRDAVSYGRSLEGVDASRVAIWGDSFSGGVALAEAR